MQSGADHAGTTAQVIPLDKPRATRDQGCLLTAACPGWSICFQQWSGLWIAQRRTGVWVCDLSTTPRTCILTDSNPVTLFLRINFQAIHDLAGEFPGWKVDQAAATGLWSAMPPSGLQGRRSDDLRGVPGPARSPGPRVRGGHRRDQRTLVRLVGGSR